MKMLVYLSSAVLLFLCPPLMLAGTVNYQYDALGRVESVAYNDASSIAYGYDSVGNRLQITNATSPVTVYEDAENGDIAGWDIYDNDPTGATIVNSEDTDRNSRVIEFSGTGLSNGYRLRNPDGSWWNNDAHSVIEWSMKYSENFVVYIAVQTTNGFRYLNYTSANYDNLGTERYVHHGLGSASRDGNWHTFTRDLEFDLQEAQPDNSIEAILGFLIRGSGRVDHIETCDTFPTYIDSDNDGLTDLEERNTYGTHPYNADTDGDGIDDGAEVTYWGAYWAMDNDGDGLINILDADSDNDGLTDGEEIEYGTDPNDPVSGTYLRYEDATDGNTDGWEVYDDDPTGAIISNVFDEDSNSRVIELSGAGRANGYRFRKPDGSSWNNTAHKVLEWRMKYSESFAVYIAIQTTDGLRYLKYTPSDWDTFGTDRIIHHGLRSYDPSESSIIDGRWRTFTRDLEYDLKEAQPENNLEAILGFYIRGSGRIDNIATINELPMIDTDMDGMFDLEERNTYGTNPYRVDTDEDGLNDGDEMIYWDIAWNGDVDGDGVINLLDTDADNDGFRDGLEIEHGTDPGDANSVIDSIMYEDAEDTDLSHSHWKVYDNDPAGAMLSVIFDPDKQSWVMDFNGSGISNGYRLRNSDGSWWNNGGHKTIEWSMKYSENFVVYIAVQTTNGFRYLRYTAANYDNLGTERYVHHGLGFDSRDGSWHTFSRDLELDLQEAQPDNHLEAILGFLIRGSGQVDDIKTTE